MESFHIYNYIYIRLFFKKNESRALKFEFIIHFYFFKKIFKSQIFFLFIYFLLNRVKGKLCPLYKAFEKIAYFIKIYSIINDMFSFLDCPNKWKFQEMKVGLLNLNSHFL